MSLITIHFRSEGIDRDTAMNVLAPDEGAGPWPVLLLLHGLGGAYDSYIRTGHIEVLLRGKPVLAVMPDGGCSWYANDARPGGIRYEDHIVGEVLGEVERLFPARRDRAGRAIVGGSMGGYGALLLGLANPDMFCAVASMSGATYFAHERSERHTDDDVFYLAQALPRERNDLFVLAEGLARTGSPSASQGSPPAAQAPAIRQSCGREDSLLGTNMAFHRHLEGLALAHEWVEHPGGHDQPTFDAQLPLALAWALVRLGCP